MQCNRELFFLLNVAIFSKQIFWFVRKDQKLEISLFSISWKSKGKSNIRLLIGWVLSQLFRYWVIGKGQVIAICLFWLLEKDQLFVALHLWLVGKGSEMALYLILLMWEDHDSSIPIFLFWLVYEDHASSIFIFIFWLVWEDHESSIPFFLFWLVW